MQTETDTGYKYISSSWMMEWRATGCRQVKSSDVVFEVARSGVERPRRSRRQGEAESGQLDHGRRGGEDLERVTVMFLEDGVLCI